MPRQSKLTKCSRHRRLILAIGTHWKAMAKITFRQRAYGPQELITKLQSYLDAVDRTGATRADWVAAIAAERKLEREVAPLLHDIEEYARMIYGDSGVELAAFGAEHRKPGPKTAEAKVAGAEKALATRAKRRTMGKRQKAKIRG
jgi:hypothetical protein